MPRFAFDHLPYNNEGGHALDRNAKLRCDPLAVAAVLPLARIVPLWRGRVLLDASGMPADLPAAHPIFEQGAAPIYLGQSGPDTAPQHWFAIDISAWSPLQSVDSEDAFLDPSETHHPAAPDHVFVELRGKLHALDLLTGEILATARALSLWHVSHRFCAACGAASEMQDAGWKRQCPACGAQHFPRTDPVVIMLVTKGNSVLLGRSHPWPQGMYSCLAGFVEPGETIEAAVAREVFEETGIRVGDVRYLASQPWPFPASLMIGMRAEALNSDITIDPVEIEDALWITREELADVFAGTHPKITRPREGAIAGFLLREWLADASGYRA
jgi:NAD+ diphosphatase